jgi:hypothetical protein
MPHSKSWRGDFLTSNYINFLSTVEAAGDLGFLNHILD